jgi:hypothetical protein
VTRLYSSDEYKIEYVQNIIYFIILYCISEILCSFRTNIIIFKHQFNECLFETTKIIIKHTTKQFYSPYSVVIYQLDIVLLSTQCRSLQDLVSLESVANSKDESESNSSQISITVLLRNPLARCITPRSFILLHDRSSVESVYAEP